MANVVDLLRGRINYVDRVFHQKKASNEEA
jgi:hypothetical protein